MKHVREPLRNQIRSTLLDRILEGRIRPKSRIAVADLAEEFDVSATPVREALTQLELDGFVVSERDRGFFVPPLELTEAEDVYPLISTVEALALDLQGLPDGQQLETLTRLNRSLGAARRSPLRAVRADQDWHEELVRKCRNTILHQSLRSLKQRAQRYEIAFMRDSGALPESLHDHSEIIKQLSEGDLETAGAALRAHWERSLEFLREWLAQPEETAPVRSRATSSVG